MDNRVVSAELLLLPATLLPWYFLKLPSCSVLWGQISACLFLLLASFALVLLHRSEAIGQQVLIARKRYRKSGELLKVLLDPRSNFFLWVSAMFLGFYFGIHASVLWTMLTEKAWVVAIPMCVYAVTCPGAMAVLLPVQFVRYLQEYLFLDEGTVPVYYTPSQVLVRILAISSVSEVAGLIALSYVSVVYIVLVGVYSIYLNLGLIQESPMYYYGIRIAAVGLALLCVCNCIMCLAMRNTRRRRRLEQQRRETEQETAGP